MCGPYFNLEAAKKSLDAVKSYDIHIYFTPGTESEWKAHETWQKLAFLFPEAITSGDLVGRVGPHLKENVDLGLKKEHFGPVVAWLQQNAEGLSILIHPKTGDEWRDHMDSALWLGKPEPFNDKFFAPLKPKAPPAPKFF